MRVSILAFCALLGGCSQVFLPNEDQTFTYKVSQSGAPSTTNKSEFDSLGEKMFSRTQRYRVSAQTDAGRQFHLLVARVEKSVGNKAVASEDSEFMPMIDGVYDYECSHYYTIALSKADDSVDSPVCKIEPIAVFVPAAKASTIK